MRNGGTRYIVADYPYSTSVNFFVDYFIATKRH
jgi:hypothetical protein